MLVKKHVNQGRLFLAICDSELIGKKFAEGNKQIDLNSDFYKGEKINEKDLLELLESVYMINAVGIKSTGFLIKNKKISKGDIIFIDKIPIAQILFF